MARYSVSDVLRTILGENDEQDTEDHDSNEENFDSEDSGELDHLSEEASSDSESDNSETSQVNDQQQIVVRGRGRGRSRTGARRGTRGRGRGGNIQQEPAVEANDDMVAKSGRKWNRIPSAVHRRTTRYHMSQKQR